MLREEKRTGFSIFYRMLIVTLAVFILVIFSVTVTYFFFSKQSVEKYAKEAIAREMQAVSYAFHNNIQDKLGRDLKILMSNPVLDEFLMSQDDMEELNARAVERLFLRTIFYLESVESISFVDWTGMEKIKVDRHGRNKDYRNLAGSRLFSSIEAQPSGGISCTPLFEGKAGEYFFTLGIHKTDPDIGEFGGAIVMKYSFKNFVNYVKQIRIFGVNPIWVLSAQNEVLLQPEDGNVNFDPRAVLSGKKKMDFHVVSLDGGLIACQYFSIVPEKPLLQVCIAIPSSLLLQDMQKVLHFLSYVFVFSLIVVIVIVFFVSRYFSRPIMELAAAVVHFPRFETSKLRDIKAFGEIHSLVENIIEMVHNLEKTSVSRDYVDNIINTMLNTLVVLTPEGKVQRVNSAACLLLDYEENEFVGMSGEQIMNEEIMEELLAGTVIRNREIIFRSKSGKQVPVLFYCSTMRDNQGETEAIVCLAQDITAQKQAEDQKAMLEAQLRQAGKMEAIGTLAGGIAHDFNNILSAVLGYAELALMHNKNEETAVQEISQVIKAGRRARDLVAQILAFSRSSGYELTPLSPHIIVKESIQMLRASFPTSMEIIQDIDPHCGSILADPTRMHQIMVNLCTNALHAMENEKGVLRISLAQKELTEEDVKKKIGVSAGPHMELKISDTGHGMDARTRERIFDPFFTTKEVGRGTGMGLAVVHGIVQDYGGVIRVESEPGKGSTFSVYIPVQGGESFSPKAEENTPLAHGSEHILVVDDEAMIVAMLKESLLNFGYQVTASLNGKEALEQFMTNPEKFDLVITDQTMPEISGSELAREILKVKPEMAIILCTGFSGMISEEKAREIGVRKFAMKPIGRRDLARMVREVLDGEKEIRNPCEKD
ncbi:MAG: response regulator [Desulfobulbaceae bacterium]|nr:response regulator [Desulfobulbaceae bacterium]